VIIARSSLFIIIVSISSFSVAGGYQTGQENKKYFFGIGAGEGGGAHGGSFNTYRISYQNLLYYNDKYKFDYLSEMGVNVWKDDSRLSAADKLTASAKLNSSNISLSYSRIVRKYLNNNIFLDLGLGLSLHNNDSMGGADLGSYYQFENRLGVGYERETYRSVLNLFHYSNGGLEGKNDGVDILMLSVSKYF